jgi:type II secretion system protein G
MMKKGFTLIELLVVVSIIGLLASVVLASLDVARTSARDTRRLADIKALQTALELYYNDFGSYPTTASWINSTQSDWQTSVLGAALTPKYIATLPIDPINNAASTYLYRYLSLSGGRAYMFLLRLEEADASVSNNDGVLTCATGPCPGGWFYDYGAPSPPSCGGGWNVPTYITLGASC